MSLGRRDKIQTLPYVSSTYVSLLETTGMKYIHMSTLLKIKNLKQACFSTFHACLYMEATFFSCNTHETLLQCMNHDCFMHREIKQA